MTKKVYTEKHFSVITKNSNWEVLSRNLVNVTRQDGVKGFTEKSNI